MVGIIQGYTLTMLLKIKDVYVLSTKGLFRIASRATAYLRGLS